MLRISLAFVLLFSFNLQAQKKEKIVYKYKKYQKFDFEDLDIEGGGDNPGDLSINNRLRKKFKNKLPYRKTFIKEIRKGVERVR